MDAKAEAIRVNALQWKLFKSLGVEVSFDDVVTLRKASASLRRWYKAEHGYARELLLRDEQGWARAYQLYGGRYDHEHSRTVPDREAMALREVAQVCARCGLAYRTTREYRGPVLFVFSQSDRTAYPQAVACE
jgi:hypothetical protein